MRSITVAVAVVVCLGTAAWADGWFNAKTYPFKVAHVSARFPAEPTVDAQTKDTDLGPLTVGTAVLDDKANGVQLVLSWTKYPPKRPWGTSKDELDAFASDLEASGKVKVSGQKDVKIGGHAGRQYKVTSANDVAMVQIVLAKPWVYFMAVRVPPMRAADYPFGAFLTSLKFL
jgi:hypothetical protein